MSAYLFKYVRVGSCIMYLINYDSEIRTDLFSAGSYFKISLLWLDDNKNTSPWWPKVYQKLVRLTMKLVTDFITRRY